MLQIEQNKPIDGFPVIDNMFLTNLMDTGVIGFIFLIIIIIYSIFISYKFNLQWISCSILALALNGLTFDAFYWEQTSIIFWLLIGLSMNIIQRDTVNRRERIEKIQYSYISRL